MAVRLHEEERPGRHDRRRPRGARRDGPQDGQAERLHADAVERPVHHRRRRDRLGLRHASASGCTRSSSTRATPRSRASPASTRPTSSSGARRTRNREAILYLIERASCRYSIIGKTKTHCGPLFDDFETGQGWDADPLHTDTATGGRWQRGNPSATARQAGTVPSGSRALVTGKAAGANASSQRRRRRRDLGPLAARSRCPAPTGVLSFRYYLAHSSNATSARLLPGLRRARGRHPDPGQAGEGRGQHRPAQVDHGQASRWRRGPARRSGSSSRRPTSARPARSRRPSTTSGSVARSGIGEGPRGSETRNVVPPPAGASTEIVPPWASTSPRAMASPSPEPRDVSPFTNRSNT